MTTEPKASLGRDGAKRSAPKPSRETPDMSRENRQVGEIDLALIDARLFDPSLVKLVAVKNDAPASDLEQVSRERDEAVRLLRPFAVYYEINDCDELDADDALEVPIGDLRLACAFLNNLDNRNE